MKRIIIGLTLLMSVAASADAIHSKSELKKINKIYSCTREIIQKKINGEDGILKAADFLSEAGKLTYDDQDLMSLVSDCKAYIHQHQTMGKMEKDYSQVVAAVLAKHPQYNKLNFETILANGFGSRQLRKTCRWGGLRASAAVIVGLQTGAFGGICLGEDFRQYFLTVVEGGFSGGLGASVGIDGSKGFSADPNKIINIPKEDSLFIGLGVTVLAENLDTTDLTLDKTGYGIGAGFGGKLQSANVRLSKIKIGNNYGDIHHFMCKKKGSHLGLKVTGRGVIDWRDPSGDTAKKAAKLEADRICQSPSGRVSEWATNLYSVAAVFECGKGCLGIF